MAEEVAAAAPAVQAKAAKSPKKKRAAPKKSKDAGSSLPKMVVAAVAESKERKGQSISGLKKILADKGVNVSKDNKRINRCVKNLVISGVLTQTKGIGASGSVKIAKKEFYKGFKYCCQTCTNSTTV
uniref:H15 domain-containing protein n=1 Tax=Cynoglossus semilaevis TaxID=244447 RepID=A0A3P8VE02_CYNSE